MIVVKNAYFIKDLGLGSGTFVKVSSTSHSVRVLIIYLQHLRNGQIVIVGENHMVVGITHGKNKNPQVALDKYYQKGDS